MTHEPVPISFSVEAGYELGLFGGEIRVEGRRLRALVEVLVAAGVLVRRGDGYGVGVVPERTAVVREGWGRLAEVIRRDAPLEVGEEHVAAFHAHLVRAGEAAAKELAPMMGDGRLIDLGGGAGAYAKGFLERWPAGRVTLVDEPAVIEMAREVLAEFGVRVELVVGDAREVEGVWDVALLANVLHLHPPEVCAALCAAAVRVVRPGGRVVIKEVRVDDGREGPIEGLLFALNMAVYTEGGDVYETGRLRRWLEEAGCVEVEERRLESEPGAVVVMGRRARSVSQVFEEVSGIEWGPVAEEMDGLLARSGDEAWRALAAGEPERLRFPGTLRQVLATAVAQERRDGAAERAGHLVRHYTDVMPRQRVALLADGDVTAARFFHTPLVWARLPRMGGAIARLVAVMAGAGMTPAQIEAAIGAPTAAAFCGRTPTLAALYRRTHYGGFMPLLYGGPADLAYFLGRGLELHAAIDRYATAPVMHELCHFAPDRDALVPPHLDEAVAGWLGVHVHPAFAYPEDDHDDAIFAAPLLSQIGAAVARAFGIAPVVRAHAGASPWAAMLPAGFLDAAVGLGWDDWRTRRTLHFLSDMLDPTPWVALALCAGAGRDLRGETLASLAATPLPSLAAALPDDPAFDRAIVGDGLRAMCLWNHRIDGSFRTRTALPDGPITIEAATCTVTAPRRGDVDTVAPRYWLPPAVAARLAAHGVAGYDLRLGAIAAIPAVADAVCAASPGAAADGFALVARRIA